MKLQLKYTMSLILTMLMISTLSAQYTSPDRMYHEDGLREAHHATLDMPVDEAKEYLEDFMKDTYDVKLKGNGFLSNKDVLRAEQVMVPSLYDNKMDLYVKFTPVNDKTEVKITGRDGYDLYFGESYRTETFNGLERMLDDYRVYAEKTYFSDRLADQQDDKKDIMRDIAKAEKKINKNEEDIEKNLEENVELQNENNSLENDLNKLNSKLSDIDNRIDSSESALKSIE